MPSYCVTVVCCLFLFFHLYFLLPRPLFLQSFYLFSIFPPSLLSIIAIVSHLSSLPWYLSERDGSVQFPIKMRCYCVLSQKCHTHIRYTAK